MNPNFTVGMAVWSPVWGEGKIVRVKHIYDWTTVEANFDNSLNNQFYNEKGFSYTDHKYPDLFILPGPTPFEVGMRVFEAGLEYGTVEEIKDDWVYINWDFGDCTECLLDGRYLAAQPYPSVLIPTGDEK